MAKVVDIGSHPKFDDPNSEANRMRRWMDGGEKPASCPPWITREVVHCVGGIDEYLAGLKAAEERNLPTKED